ncbi:AMP-binding protein [Oceanobacillus salinisoli]|uniref:AMP-binding protein n=1 Tax=Oceanobacillus salinisoli TaxID=2678611 RepID=UPI0012E1C92C|nr:AMP-binding protein [Oceanobacillus salinisoli]
MELINQLVDRRMEETPNKTYLFTKHEEITYKDLYQTVNRLAVSLKSFGVEKGDRVGLYLNNSPNFLYSWFALNRLGAIMVPINTSLLSKETLYILQDSQVKGIISEESAIPAIINPILSQCSSIEFSINVGDKEFDGWHSISNLLENDGVIDTVVLEETNLASILYTSGTTGNPKGVMCPTRYYYYLAKGFVDTLLLKENDRLMTCLPLFHMNAQVITVTASLLSGASVILLEGFSASSFWKDVAHFKPTVFYYLGSILPILMKLPVTEEEKMSTLRVAVGAQADASKLEQYETRWNLKMIELYGMTEGGGTINPLNARKPGSCGKAYSNHELRIVNEQDEFLPANTAGEIVFRGPSLTLGYWNNKEETDKAYRNGWMHSGDIGYMDEEGYLYFLDRKKDIIRRSGENISPAEVEKVLMAHPSIVEAACIAVPDEIRNEEVKAYLVVKEGELVRPEEIIEWCENNLAKFKIPKYIEFRSQLPKTKTLKIQKNILKQEKADLRIGAWDSTLKRIYSKER